MILNLIFSIIFKVQDGNIYENFKEYFNVITTAEKEVCQQGILNLEVLEKDIEEVFTFFLFLVTAFLPYFYPLNASPNV